MKHLFLFLVLSSWYSLEDNSCEQFYNANIKKLEFSRAEVVNKYSKDGYVYIDLKNGNNRPIAFTLKNYDTSNFMKKIAVGQYVNKAKNELVLQRIVLYGASADVFRHVLKCN